jgi:hypothetical protein
MFRWKFAFQVGLVLAVAAAPRLALADTSSCRGKGVDVQVEVFGPQKFGRLMPGQTRALKLKGQVNGTIDFRGNVTFLPNNPTGTPNGPACPLFVSGTNPNLDLKAGQPFTLTVTLKAPASPPRQDGNCALKYSALYTDKTPPCEASKGNEVDKPYRVRPTPPAPGEDPGE